MTSVFHDITRVNPRKNNQMGEETNDEQVKRTRRQRRAGRSRSLKCNLFLSPSARSSGERMSFPLVPSSLCRLCLSPPRGVSALCLLWGLICLGVICRTNINARNPTPAAPFFLCFPRLHLSCKERVEMFARK